MKLMTCGYEGLVPEQFFELLKANKVQTIVDVRELPISHKPGFAKSALAAGAAKHKLRYVHMPALGCPRDIRHDYRADRDWARYKKRFTAYLKTQKEAVQELADLAKRERCCLLCFEADAAYCHRSFVAQQVAGVVGKAMGVEHLRTI